MKKVVLIIIIFLVLLSIGVILLVSSMPMNPSNEPVRLQEENILVFDITKSYPERSDFDFNMFMSFSKPSLEFYKLIETLEYVKTDDRVKSIYIKGGGTSFNRAQAEEIYAKLKALKGEKKIYGYSEYLFLGDAYLMSLCDSVFMPESGTIFVPGFYIEPYFYKGLFDKLGVGFDVVQAGKYKGGYENFRFEQFTEPFTESLDAMLDDFYAIYQDRITSGRGLQPDYFDSLLTKGMIYGDDILKSGLVDGLLYKNQLDSLLKETVDVSSVLLDDEDDVFVSINKYAKKIETEKAYSNDKIALIVAEGTIMPGIAARKSPFSSNKGIYSTTYSKLIDEAADDDEISAIVLRVDSPGGSALASDIIWNSLKRAKAKKPLVISMASVAASGGYYISMIGDSIFAGEGTLTGSIGVYGGKLFIDGLLEKAEVTTQTFKRGEYAGMMSTINRPWNEKERELMTKSIAHTYKEFVSKAAEGRNTSYAKLDSVAQGRIWSGMRAKKQGLVDKNGGVWDAIRCAQKMINIPLNETPSVVLYPKKKTFFDIIEDFENISANYVASKLPFAESFINSTEISPLMFHQGECMMVCPIEVQGEVSRSLGQN